MAYTNGATLDPTATDKSDTIYKWKTANDTNRMDFKKSLLSLHEGLVKDIKNERPPPEQLTPPGSPQNGASTNSWELSVIKSFLSEENGKMDDCIRWLLLYDAIQFGGKDSMQLAEMIMTKNSRLVFHVTKNSLLKTCRERDMQSFGLGHTISSKVKADSLVKIKSMVPAMGLHAASLNTSLVESLFCLAVRSGNETMVRLILDCTQMYLRENGEPNPNETLLQLARGGGTNTALAAAVKAGNTAIGTAGVVLDMLPNFITPEDTALSDAIESSAARFIDKFLSYPESRKLLTARENIIKALKKVRDASSHEQKTDALYVAQAMLQCASDEERFSPEVLGSIMEQNLMDIWADMDDITRASMPRLLHTAVLYQRYTFVMKLLQKHPKMALDRQKVAIDDNVQDNENRPPLWYNNNMLVGKEWKKRPMWTDTRRKIRSALVYCTVKYASNMRALTGILQDSEEPERERCFDLSRFHFEHGGVSEFIQSLSHHDKSRQLLKYEETIRYAEFPVLDLNVDECEWPQSRSFVQTEHTEVFDTLDWLANHGVKRIITLRVPDRMMNPHDEVRISDTVRRFQVEELDWRFLDLSLDIFSPHGEEPSVELSDDKESSTSLTKLHLYSSGKRSVLNHWFGKEGIRSMHLHHLHIHIVNELMTRHAATAIALHIRNQVGMIADEFIKENKLFEDYVDSEFWNPAKQMVQLKEIDERISPRLAQFTEYYRKTAHARYQQNRPESYPATKVAIIDNGILSVSLQTENSTQDDNNSASDSNDDGGNKRSADFFEKNNLWSRICEGKSFADEQDCESPWFLASNPRGTQMANLLCAIDPLCELYVAKVPPDGQDGYSAEQAAKAVDWAIKKKVDIISMSFTTKDVENKFDRALTRAQDAGIILLCSLHDKASRVGTVLPLDAKASTKLRLASCNEFGNLEPNIDEREKGDKYDFCISSQNIAAGVIPFLDSSECISGSSVATALTAGLCSLILSCRWLVAKDATAAAREATGKRNNFRLVKAYLQMMASKTNGRFLVLEQFAELDELEEINNIRLHQALLSIEAKLHELDLVTL